MLDEEHTQLEQHANDSNEYILGRMCIHYIVIACLSFGVPGSTLTTFVANQMLFSFPAIRIGLLVGIGGGAPSADRDIRLGG
jgi:hypothetical protein